MASSILTITLNPAIDRIVRPGCGSPCGALSAGGKGVNVARALRALGMPVRAVGLAGGPAGRMLGELLDEEGIDHRFLAIRARTRTNVTIAGTAEEARRTVLPGARTTEQERSAFAAFFARQMRGFGTAVFSGSLPPAFPVKDFAALIRRAQRAGALTAVDTRGPALRAALELGVDVIKPNREEAQEALGVSLSSQAMLRKALRTFIRYGIKKVLISMGAEGIAASDGSREVWVRCPVVKAGHTVGCGDAALAGFLAAHLRGRGLEACTAHAAACGYASALADIPGAIMKKDVRHAFTRRKVTWL